MSEVVVERTVSQPGLLQATGILFAMTMASNGFSYLFHALASRSLGPAGYGALVSMLSVITIMFIPGQAIQAVVAREVAAEHVLGHDEQVLGFGFGVLKHVSFLGLAVCGGLIASSFWMKSFFKLPSIGPVITTGFVMMIFLLVPVIRGLLQGLQAFGWLGVNVFLESMLRVAAAAGMFAVGWGVSGGVLSGGVAAILAGVLLLWPLWPLLLKTKTLVVPQTLVRTYRSGLPILLTFGAFTALYSVDVLMVKHYFSASSAGYYAAASLIGKAFLFLPYAITQVLFPKVSAGHSQHQDTRRLLGICLGLTLVGLVAGVVAVALLARWVVPALFGQAFANPDTLQLVRWFGVAITPLALTWVVVQYHMAIRNSRFAWWFIFDIPVLLLALVLFHDQLRTVLLVVGCNHMLLLLASQFTTWRKVHGIAAAA